MRMIDIWRSDAIDTAVEGNQRSIPLNLIRTAWAISHKSPEKLYGGTTSDLFFFQKHALIVPAWLTLHSERRSPQLLEAPSAVYNKLHQPKFKEPLALHGRPVVKVLGSLGEAVHRAERGLPQRAQHLAHLARPCRMTGAQELTRIQAGYKAFS